MREKIEKIVIESIILLSNQLPGFDMSEYRNPNLETRLYTGSENLNSLELVSLISDIEERLENILSIRIIIADEKAFSLKNSPFLTVNTLINYICMRADKGS